MDGTSNNRQRDIATLKVLGIFFSIMGGLVLIGTYEAVGNSAAMIVSVCSGLTLLAIGLGMWFVSCRMAATSGDST